MTWAAWHDLDDTPFCEGTEAEAKAAALPGAAEGDFVESPAGDHFGWNPVSGLWDLL